MSRAFTCWRCGSPHKEISVPNPAFGFFVSMPMLEALGAVLVEFGTASRSLGSLRDEVAEARARREKATGGDLEHAQLAERLAIRALRRCETPHEFPEFDWEGVVRDALELEAFGELSEWRHHDGRNAIEAVRCDTCGALEAYDPGRRRYADDSLGSADLPECSYVVYRIPGPGRAYRVECQKCGETLVMSTSHATQIIDAHDRACAATGWKSRGGAE